MMALSVDPALPLAASTPTAFEDVYRAHFDFVWRVLCGMGVASSDLEDVAQEVFVIALKKLPEFDGRASLKTWLFEIALRVASNHRRSVRRKGQRTELDERIAESAPGPAELAESRRALLEVTRIFDALDDDLRLVLFLTEIEQMTAPEIAELTGMKINTVSSRLRRGRQAFALELERRRRGER
jgi:RNA polymerase sigma-70 factor (ECF subfamily)